MFKMYWLEMKRFLKKYLKFILISSIVIGIIFSFSMSFIENTETPSIPDEEEIENELDIFHNDSRSAYFRFYIRHPDGYVFNNSGTMYDLFSAKKMYATVLEETGIDLLELKNEVRSQGQFDDYEPAKVVINNNSNIFTAVFDTGSNENNLEIANFYHDYLLGDNFGPLEGNLIYSIASPQLIEEIVEEEEVVVDSESLDLSFVINAGIGFLIGIAISFIIALIKEFFGKNLSFAFTYIPEETSDFLVYNSDENDDKLIKYFLNTNNNLEKQIILSETSVVDKYNTVFDNEKTAGSLLELDSSSDVEEIVIVVDSGNTTRKWFKSQIDLGHLLKTPVKVIQINN